MTKDKPEAAGEVGDDAEAIMAAHRAFDNAFCAGETTCRAVEEAIVNYKAYLPTPSPAKPVSLAELDDVALWKEHKKRQQSNISHYEYRKILRQIIDAANVPYEEGE